MRQKIHYHNTHPQVQTYLIFFYFFYNFSQ